MGRTVRILAALSLAGFTAPLAAETAPLKPVTRWHSESDGDRCRVSRVFSHAGQNHLVMLEQFARGSGVSLTVAGPALASIAGGRPAPLSLTHGQSTVELEAVNAEVPIFGPTVMLMDVPLGVAPSAATAQSELGASGELTLARSATAVRFQTGSLEEPGALLEACTLKLAASLGLDVSDQRAATTPQWLNRATLHPRIAGSFRDSGPRQQVPRSIAHLRVIVSEAGVAEDCTLIFATGWALDNNKACRLMRKARFRPALNTSGQPVRSAYAASFRDYRLDPPKGEVAPNY
jgi:hypothetical protein